MITLFKDPFFNSFDDVFETSKIRNTPKVDVDKDDYGYTIQMSVPGLTKDDLKILIKDGVLSITHEKSEKTENLKFVSSFKRMYTIPDDVKEKDIVGKVENGVLYLSLPIDKKKPSERLISLN
jgi:HSP20 family protein